ncbi:ETS domain-containing protein [Endozoicomonadaceae bacterium StTr2]
MRQSKALFNIKEISKKIQAYKILAFLSVLFLLLSGYPHSAVLHSMNCPIDAFMLPLPDYILAATEKTQLSIHGLQSCMLDSENPFVEGQIQYQQGVHYIHLHPLPGMISEETSGPLQSNPGHRNILLTATSSVEAKESFGESRCILLLSAPLVNLQYHPLGSAETPVMTYLSQDSDPWGFSWNKFPASDITESSIDLIIINKLYDQAIPPDYHRVILITQKDNNSAYFETTLSEQECRELLKQSHSFEDQYNFEVKPLSGPLIVVVESIPFAFTLANDSRGRVIPIFDNPQDTVTKTRPNSAFMSFFFSVEGMFAYWSAADYSDEPIPSGISLPMSNAPLGPPDMTGYHSYSSSFGLPPPFSTPETGSLMFSSVSAPATASPFLCPQSYPPGFPGGSYPPYQGPPAFFTSVSAGIGDSPVSSDSEDEIDTPPAAKKRHNPGRKKSASNRQDFTAASEFVTRLEQKQLKEGARNDLTTFICLALKDSKFSALEWEDEAARKFRFIRPEVVARAWGSLRQKPDMNYEKLSRAMRYHYKRATGGFEQATERLTYKLSATGKNRFDSSDDISSDSNPDLAGKTLTDMQ